MQKLGPKQIKEAIVKQALLLKRKKELYNEAKKINSELIQLNEYGHPGVMLGLGFNPEHLQKSKIGGYMDGSEALRPVEGKGFDALNDLEEEIGQIEQEEVAPENTELTQLKAENEALKQKIAEIEKALGKEAV